MLPVKDNGTRLIPKKWRIMFMRSSDKAFSDRLTFKRWMSGEYSTEMAIRAISMNNKVPVTEEQFLATAEWLGYRRSW